MWPSRSHPISPFFLSFLSNNNKMNEYVVYLTSTPKHFGIRNWIRKFGKWERTLLNMCHCRVYKYSRPARTFSSFLVGARLFFEFFECPNFYLSIWNRNVSVIYCLKSKFNFFFKATFRALTLTNFKISWMDGQMQISVEAMVISKTREYF